MKTYILNLVLGATAVSAEEGVRCEKEGRWTETLHEGVATIEECYTACEVLADDT